MTYIIQRLASLATLFYFASLSFYVKGRLLKRKIRYLYFTASAITAVLGIFTKEIVFTLPFSMLLFEVYFFRTGIKDVIKSFKNKKLWLYMIPFLLFILILPHLLSFNLSTVFGTTSSQRYSDPPLTSGIYLITQFRVIVTYIRLLFLPINQNLDYDFPASRSFFELSALLSFLFLASIVFFAFRNFSRHRLASFGILWFFLALSVESSLKPLPNVIFEHRPYLPMLGYCLFFYKEGKLEDAKKQFYNALGKSPDYITAYFNLGNILMMQKNFEEAIRVYYDVLRIDPGNLEAHSNLWAVYYQLGKTEEAQAHLDEANRLRNELLKENK